MRITENPRQRRTFFTHRKRRRRLHRRDLRRLLMETLEDRRVLASWSGTISTDTTWGSGEIHEITNDVTVAENATLTIAPGAIVKFHHANADLIVNGTLDARGTESQSIIFTALRDDVGGDTNGDGAATVPGPGQWARIYVAGVAEIDHAEIRYGGYFYGAMVISAGGDLTVTNSVLSNSTTDGVRVEDSDPVLVDNQYLNHGSAAISMDLNSNPDVRGVTLAGNHINGLQVDSGTAGRNLVWDDPEIPYRLDFDITVPTGLSLSVTAGQIIKPADSNLNLIIDGSLDVAGTAEAPVIFTSVYDDSRGGDTNGDGDATSPNRGNWARIYLRDPSINNRIDHAEFHYGGYFVGHTLFAWDTDLSVTNSVFTNSATDAIRLDGTDAVLLNNEFRDNADAAVSIELNANPTIQGVTVSGNGINGLQVDSGTLEKDLTWNNPDIVYRLDHDITVPAGKILRVDSGQIVKPSNANLNLLIDGTLDIAGTVSAPVVFTSVHDDTRGGDTNGNGDATAPTAGNWARISMRDSSVGNRIEYAEFHYGGYFVGHTVQAVDTDLIVANSVFADSAGDGLRLDGTDAFLTDNTFVRNRSAAISMELNSNPTIEGVTVADNAINGLQVDSGTLEKSLVWNNPDIVYRLDYDITVPEGISLHIDAGQIVKPADTNLNLLVDGTLTVTGTPEQPVVFTSAADDARGGDTNGNGDASVPSPGDWARIYLRDASAGNTIEHAEFHYGGYFVGSMLHARDTELVVRNSLFANSATDGVRIDGTDAVLIDNRFLSNRDAAVSTDLNSNPEIRGVQVSGNFINGLQVDSGTVLKDLVWNNPEIVYRLNQSITVPAGLTLQIGAGQIVKPADRNLNLYVDGSIDIAGSETAPVIFTSVHDDARGGDTNGNGDATLPNNGDWARILMRDASSGNRIENAEFHFGGYFVGNQVHAIDTDLTVSSSLFANSATDGLRLDGTDAILADNRFLDNGDAAISMGLNSNPDIAGVAVSGNFINGLQIDSGTLKKDLVWDNPDIVYWLVNDVTVPIGNTLTLGAGQIVKPSHSNSEILVSGTLRAVGTVSDPVVITSARDDSAGGDTNNDGTDSAPLRGNWARIYLGPSSVDNVLENIDLRYGGYFYGGTVIADATNVSLSNATIQDSDTDGVRGTNSAVIELENSVIVASRYVGVSAYSGTHLSAMNNTIVGNDRGILSGSSATVELTNNLITFNQSVGVASESGGAVTFSFNDLYNPDGSNVAGIDDPTGSQGNLSADPLYFSRVNRQFNLLSGSPAVDSATSDGAPLTDRLGNSRFDDPNVLNSGSGSFPFFDIGALERQEISTSQVDLQSLTVIGADSGIQDDRVTVEWTVENIGKEPATGSWHDGVFLSVDTIWTPDDVFLGDFEHVGSLGPGARYSGSGEVVLPGVSPGDYYLIVRTDVRNEVFEALQEPNNASASPPIVLDLPQLPLGNPIQGTLDGPGDYKLYRVAVPDGADLTVAVDGPAGVEHQLFISYEEAPSRQRFDQRGVRPDSASQFVSIADTREGTYIVMVYGADVPSTGETFTLSANLAGFAIESIRPFQGANLGDVTVEVTGAQFTGNTAVQLIDSDGMVIDASAIYFSDSGKINATFDLSNAATGFADVRVINPGSVSTELPGAFEVIAGVPGTLQAVARVPSRVRGGRSFSGFIEYRNTGNTDLLIPFLTISTNGLDLLDFDSSLDNASTQLHFLAANPEGPAGILPPGAAGRIPIYGQSTGAGSDSITVSAGNFPDSTIPWADLKEELMPPGADPAEFDAIYQQIQTQIGDQWQAYEIAISNAASLLPPSMGSPQSLQDVFSVEILKARDALGTSVSGRLFLNDLTDTLVDASLTLVDSQQQIAYNATSLTDGSFTFTDVVPGNYQFTLDGYQLQSSLDVTVGQDSLDLGDTIVTHGAEINGAVLLDQFGIPARGVIVSASSDQGFFVTQTDQDGQYDFRGLPAGSYQLSTESDLFSTVRLANVQVPSKGVMANVNLAVESSGSISGTVRDASGIPLAGASVFATLDGYQGKSGTTDANGNYLITGLGAGQYNVVFTLESYAQAALTEIVLGTGDSVSGVSVDLIPGGTLAGTIASSSSAQGIPFASVALFAGSTPVASAEADIEGNYTLADVAPGVYDAVLSAQGFQNFEQTIAITASQTLTFSPTLSPSGTLSGIIRDGEGQPLAGLLVSAKDPVLNESGYSVTDSGGHFQIRNLPLGQYGVRVGSGSAIGLAYRSVTFTESTANQVLDVSLETSGYISGTVTGVSSEPIEGAVVRLMRDGETVHETFSRSDGSYTFVILQDGTYDIAAGAANLVYPISETLSISGGNRVSVDFVPGTETFAGVLTDETSGDPIAGATVLLSQNPLGYAISSPPNQQTDADGTFQFTGLASGEYEIQFLVPGKATILQTVTVGSSPGSLVGLESAPMTFSAKPGYTLSGTLRTDFIGTPIPNGQINVYRQSDGKNVGAVGTDENGNYHLAGLPDGSYDLVASGGGYQYGSLESVGISGGDTFVDVSLQQPTSTVNGTVNAPDLGPLDRLNVKISDPTNRVTELVKVQPDGTFSTGVLPPGSYHARAVGNGVMSDPVPIDVSAGDNSGFVIHTSSVAGSDQDEPFIPPPDSPQPGDTGWYNTTIDTRSLEQIIQEMVDAEIPSPAKGCEPLYARAVSLFKSSLDYAVNAKSAREAQRVTIKVSGVDTGLDADNAIRTANALIVLGDIASLITSVKDAVDAVANLDDNIKAAMRGREAAVEAAEFIKFLGTKKSALFGLGNKIYGIGSNVIESIQTGKAPPPTLVLDVEGALVDISNLAREILVEFQNSPNLIAVGTVATVVLGPVNSLVGLILNTKAAVDDFNKSAKGIADRAQAARNADVIANLVAERYRTALARLAECNQKGPDGPDPPPAPGGSPISTTPVANVISFDPNDKTGAAGFGEDGFVVPGTIPYLIQFENDPDLGATVPAQEVFISDTLDSDLDLTTFQFSQFGFGEFVFDVPSGLSYFTDIIDLRPDGIDLLVEVVLDVNFDSRQMTASWRSLDPLTQRLPDAIDAGFLPVNDKQVGNGEGFLSYTVDTNSDVATGTELINTAEIVFDLNDPIVTPTARNTIDTGAPTSGVVQLAEAYSTPDFIVQWSGQDDALGSGIVSYDVYVSEDGGAYTPWLLGTTATSAEFMGGLSGSTYAFVSVARDAVGNVEAFPSVPDTETLVIINAWVNPVDVYDVNGNGNVTPLDALVIINEMARSSVNDPITRVLIPLPPDGYAPPYYDVTQDGRITTLDALRVINYIARSVLGGEQTTPLALPDPPPPQDQGLLDRPLLESAQLPESEWLSSDFSLPSSEVAIAWDRIDWMPPEIDDEERDGWEETLELLADDAIGLAAFG